MWNIPIILILLISSLSFYYFYKSYYYFHFSHYHFIAAHVKKDLNPLSLLPLLAVSLFSAASASQCTTTFIISFYPIISFAALSRKCSPIPSADTSYLPSSENSSVSRESRTSSVRPGDLVTSASPSGGLARLASRRAWRMQWPLVCLKKAYLIVWLCWSKRLSIVLLTFCNPGVSSSESEVSSQSCFMLFSTGLRLSLSKMLRWLTTLEPSWRLEFLLELSRLEYLSNFCRCNSKFVFYSSIFWL